MFYRCFNLVLTALLLLPPGVCPCHLLEDYFSAAAPHEGELPDAHEGHACPHEHCGEPLAPDSEPGHEEEPCEDCQARKLIVGQYLSPVPDNLSNDHSEPAPPFGAPVIALTAPLAPVFQSAPLSLSSGKTPLYLKVRALLL